MSPKQLLAYFDRIAEAPGAVPRLRRFILDLAVRGKLVEQDPSDEPASELLSRIQAVRVDETGRRAPRISGVVPVESSDAPFVLPDTWQWARFGAIADFSAGRTPSRNDTSFWNTGEYSWVSIADIDDGGVVTRTKETISQKAKRQVFRADPNPVGTLLMSFKLTIGKIARLAVPAFHNEAIVSIWPRVPEMDAFLLKMLPQFAQQGTTKAAIKGATLNRESISNILIPVPPFPEQRRIVARRAVSTILRQPGSPIYCSDSTVRTSAVD